VYAVRFRAYGRREYVTLGSAEEGWTRQRAEEELWNILADVRRGIWQPPAPPATVEVVEDPGFHRFASDWLESRKPELKPRSIEALEWALTHHLLPFFRSHRLNEITVAEVDGYRLSKVQARERAERPLSNRSINLTIAILGQVLDAAIEHGFVAGANPARGKRRRLRAEKPKRTWLELDELRDLLDASGEHRPLLAVMALGGLRVGEATTLRWGHVDLANGRLRVLDAKTDAGRRTVDLSPSLRDELASLKAATNPEPGDLVFLTKAGTQRDRHNVRNRVLKSALRRANEKRSESGEAPIQDGVTNHTLRRTFASLLYEAGASPAYVMAQMGHTSSALALDVYARMMRRERDTGARMDALLCGAEWAPMGTIGGDTHDTLPPQTTPKEGSALV
jgi:integrase